MNILQYRSELLDGWSLVERERERSTSREASEGMAARRSPVLTDKEERQMSKLRQKLFECNWDSAEFKASVRDLVSHVLVRIRLARA